MADLFDQADASSIESFGQRLLKTTLRKKQGVLLIPQNLLDLVPGPKSKGSMGGLVENYYYDIHPGNTPGPDFPLAGVELKTTPLKKLKKGEYSAKERLALNMINYIKEAESTFETSSFYTKNRLIMLIGYLHKKGIALGDLEILVAKLTDFEKLPELDKKIIREDWERINSKIKASKAHEISEGDTLYLAACTKSSTSSVERKQFGTDTEAKPRAYSFKGSYMTRLFREIMTKHEEESLEKEIDTRSEATFEEQVLYKFSRYYGKTDIEIEKLLAVNENRQAKGYLPTLVKRMLGIKGKSIPEFEAAEISIKTIQISSRGNLPEHMSFPAFSFKGLILQKWDAETEEELATFQDQLEKRFLIVVFQNDARKEGGARKLLKVFFWSMPYADRLEAKKMWEETRRRIEMNIYDLPGIKETRVAHVRPHGVKGSTDSFPDGTIKTKQGFWLNKGYMKEVVEKN